MAILRLCYGDLKEKVIELGDMRYHFDPTCEVDDPEHGHYLLSLRPKMFEIVTKEEAVASSTFCPVCGKCATEFKDMRGFNGHVRWCTKYSKKEIADELA